MGLFDRFSKGPPPRIVRDGWNGYTYLFGDRQRCVVSFDASACDTAVQHPSMGVRVIGFSLPRDVGPTGMPSPQAFERLKAIERAMIAQLTDARVSCWHVGTHVYSGFRELVFQVDDLPAFQKVFDAVEAKHGGMKLVQKDGWTFFNEKIAPGVRGTNHIGNREVLTGLKQAGSDFTRPHALDHHFLGDARALETVVVAAGGDFRVTARSESSVTLTMTAVISDQSQDALDELTMRLRMIAERSGARYDGWGAMVVR